MPFPFQCFKALQLALFPTSNDKKCTHMPCGTADGTCGSARGTGCCVTLAAADNSSSMVLCHEVAAAIHATIPY